MRALIVVLILIASGSQALAKIQFCNKFQHPIRIALAYQQNGAWVSEGWITVGTNECQIDTKHADVTSFYYYGETDVFDNQIVSWGRDKEFSVKTGNFTLRAADMEQGGARLVKFAGPRTYKLPTTTVVLQFEADRSVKFIVPAEKPSTAGPPSALDAARDTCNNKSGDVAIQGCTEVIRNDPDDADAYYNRGIEYANKDDYDRAIADYSKAISINPNYARAYNNRATSFFFGKDDAGHAIADLTKAIDIDPKYAIARRTRGNVYRIIGAYKLALKDLNDAIDLNPKANLAVFYRGRTYEALGRKDEAIADFRQVLVLDPDDQDSKDALKRLGANP